MPNSNPTQQRNQHLISFVSTAPFIPSAVHATHQRSPVQDVHSESSTHSSPSPQPLSHSTTLLKVKQWRCRSLQHSHWISKWVILWPSTFHHILNRSWSLLLDPSIFLLEPPPIRSHSLSIQHSPTLPIGWICKQHFNSFLPPQSCWSFLRMTVLHCLLESSLPLRFHPPLGCWVLGSSSSLTCVLCSSLAHKQ